MKKSVIKFDGVQKDDDDSLKFELKQIELDTAQRISIRRVSITETIKSEEKKDKDTESLKENKIEKEAEKPKVPKQPSWYDKNFNEEKAKSRKDQEIQTDTKEQVYKSYIEYLQNNSKGIQVDENDKMTLREMRFDLFRKNLHLKYDTDVTLFQLKKEITEVDETDNNRTFWDYLNYNKKTYRSQDRFQRNKPELKAKSESSWDNDDEVSDIDEEEFYRNNQKQRLMRQIKRPETFTWQVDEFNELNQND